MNFSNVIQRDGSCIWMTFQKHFQNGSEPLIQQNKASPFL